jgi:hypothetical protein
MGGILDDDEDGATRGSERATIRVVLFEREPEWGS